MGENRDVLGIFGLEIECVVGVYPRERGTPQPLTVDVELELDTQLAAESGNLSRSMDYEGVARQVEAVLVGCRFRLLETAAHALCKLLLAPPAPGERRAAARSVTLRLQKPEALPGRAIAALTVTRAADWFSSSTQSAPFGAVQVLHDTKEAGLFRLVVEAGRQVRLPPVGGAGGVAFGLCEGLTIGGRAFRVRTREPLGEGRGQVVSNPTRASRTLLLVTCQRQGVLERVQAERQGTG